MNDDFVGYRLDGDGKQVRAYIIRDGSPTYIGTFANETHATEAVGIFHRYTHEQAKELAAFRTALSDFSKQQAERVSS